MRGKALVVLALAALLTPLTALPARSTAYCFGMPVTMTATPGVPTHGTAGDDVILGTNGDDTIYGNGGKDRICGRGGNDRLYGGPGRDRIAGEAGNDIINSGAGKNHVLKGGDGNDTIRAQGYGDTASGGRGNDTLISAHAFLTLIGNAGDDNLISDYRNGLDAGVGRDRCTLALGVPGTGCETVQLNCGTGGALPPAVMPPGSTSALGDFDGNGTDDTLRVWKQGVDWIAHIETDGGFGAQTTLSTSQYESAEAIGGYDVNGDGMAEAFLLVGSGASSDIVGLYTLHQPDPDEIPFYTCGLEPVRFNPTAEATFVIDPGLFAQTGLQCRAHRVLRVFYQDTLDGTSYRQDRYDYGYLPRFAEGFPILGMKGSLTDILLTRPLDNVLIDRAGRFTCGGLSL